MNLTKMKKKKGFTLIELMAVIAIIAILAAVLVPTVSGYINRSKKTAIITQVRTAVTAIEAYNATASTQISTTSEAKLTTLVDETKGKLLKAELLTAADIDKLKDMTIATSFNINKDQNAISGIVINNGKFTSYTAAP